MPECGRVRAEQLLLLQEEELLCECELLLDGTAMAGELCRERVAARCAFARSAAPALSCIAEQCNPCIACSPAGAGGSALVDRSAFARRFRSPTRRLSRCCD